MFVICLPVVGPKGHIKDEHTIRKRHFKNSPIPKSLPSICPASPSPSSLWSPSCISGVSNWWTMSCMLATKPWALTWLLLPTSCNNNQGLWTLFFLWLPFSAPASRSRLMHHSPWDWGSLQADSCAERVDGGPCGPGGPVSHGCVARTTCGSYWCSPQGGQPLAA